MSYTAREQSDYDGHPLELYRISLGDRQWLYTSADHEVTFGEDQYQPVYVRRGGFTRGGDARKSTLEVEVAATNPVALVFRNGWLPGAMILNIYRHHYEDAEFSVLWKGRVTGCKWSGSVASLSSDSVATLFRRAGLRRVFQIPCPHILFGAACGLDKSAWDYTAAVTAVSANLVTLAGAAALGDGYFTGGMLKSGDEYRMIVAHSGNVLTLVDAVAELVVGASVTAWPGCARTVAACKDKFDNLDNYGGLPFLPSKNPFTGDALV